MSEKERMVIVLGRIQRVSFINRKSLTQEEFFNELLDFLKNSKQYTDKNNPNFVWVFGDISSMEVDGEKIIFGRLGKIKRGSEEIVYDFKEKKFKKIEQKGTARALTFSNFVIYPKHHLIAFQEKGNKLSYKRFVEVFEEMSKKYYGYGTWIKITVIPDRETILFRIMEFRKILMVHITVSPPNPVDAPEWEKFRKLLNESKAETAKIDLKNEEDGLDPDSTLIKGGVHLAISGYGRAKIEGETEYGEREVVDSKDSIQRRIIRISTDSIEGIASRLFREIKSFISRTKEKSRDE